MSFAIDETKLLRSIKNSTALIRQLEAVNPGSHRLLFLKRELSNLEARLAKIRSKVSRIDTVTR